MDYAFDLFVAIALTFVALNLIVRLLSVSVNLTKELLYLIPAIIWLAILHWLDVPILPSIQQAIEFPQTIPLQFKVLASHTQTSILIISGLLFVFAGFGVMGFKSETKIKAAEQAILLFKLQKSIQADYLFYLLDGMKIKSKYAKAALDKLIKAKKIETQTLGEDNNIFVHFI